MDDESSEMQATEMGADALPRDQLEQLNDSDSDIDEKSRVSMREEGERVLNEVLEQDEMREALIRNGKVSSEVKDLYEMQIFEQRKLQDTIGEVKKQVEFLYNGVFPDDDTVRSKKMIQIDSPSLEFIESARDRLRHLENEGEMIEQNYRDYQHKVKSKYYPINDDEEGEIKLVARKNKKQETLDVERFLETTLKASIGAKVMREQLETEWSQYSRKQEATVFNEAKLKAVEQLINSAPIVPAPVKDLRTETDEIRRQILKDQEELKRFENFQSISSVKFNDGDKIQRKVILDDSSATEMEVKKPSVEAKKSEADDDRTIASEFSEKKDPAANKGFAANDYLKMMSIREKQEKQSSDEEPQRPAMKTRVTIQYSPSGSESSQSDSNERKQLSYGAKNMVKQSKKSEDDEDDDW